MKRIELHTKQRVKAGQEAVYTRDNLYVMLKALRMAHKLTQADLGAIIGLDQGSVSRIENSHAPVNVHQYKALVDKFGEDEVTKFIGDSTWKEKTINCEEENEKRELIKSLYKMIEVQTETIKSLSRAIELLTAKKQKSYSYVK